MRYRPAVLLGLALFAAHMTSLPGSSAAASLLERIGFVLEPGLQYGGPIQRKRFRESNIRYNLDAGFAFGTGSDSKRRLGVTVHSSFAGSDSRFSIRPRFTWGAQSSRTYTLSAGYIFYTAEDANDIEDAEVSNAGFVGGGSLNLGDLALQLDVSIVDVGPTFGYEGGTETSLFGGVSYLGTSGVKVGVFALSIVFVLSVIYAASVS